MNEEFRKNAPEPLEALPFRVPTPSESTLSCGLKVVAVHDERHPLVSFRLAFGSGDINDPEGRIGVSSAMSSLLNEGTENYSSKELAESIDNIGASLAASSASDHTVVKASALSVFVPKVLDLMAELVLRPVFPEDELELYRQNTIEGLKYQRSQPDFLADEQVSRVVYGDHPYSVNSPSEKDIRALERNWLVDFHKRAFIPNNAVLVAVGDIDPESLVEELEKRFAGWSAGEVPQRDYPAFPARSGRTLTVVDRPGSTQANIVLSNIAVDRRSPDYFPFLVMNQVLGAGASSRLFMNLREEKGYTYGAYSRIIARRFGGSFEASAEVRTAVTGDSLKEFFFELERIRNVDVPASELEDAKNYLMGVFPIRVETQGALIGQIAAQRIYGLPADYLESYCENVSKITSEDVARAANLYVHPDSIAIVIVGDAEEVVPMAKDYCGDVEVYDTDGNQKDAGSYSAKAEEGPAVDVEGRWDLTVTAQGQDLALILDLEGEGDAVTGHLESMIGQGTLRDAAVNGNRIKANILTEMQGQELEIGFTATVAGEDMTGALVIPMMPEPLEFKGRRVATE